MSKIPQENSAHILETIAKGVQYLIRLREQTVTQTQKVISRETVAKGTVVLVHNTPLYQWMLKAIIELQFIQEKQWNCALCNHR